MRGRIRTFVLIVALLGAVVNCASHHAASGAAATAAAATEAPAPEAPLAWRYTLPAGSDLSSVVQAGDLEIAAGTFGLVAIDAASGVVRWRQTEPLHIAIASNATLFTATPQGGMEARSTHGGGVIWRDRHVCEMQTRPVGSPVGGVQVITRDEGDIIVGCVFGRLARLDARTGATLASTDAFAMDDVSAIVPLGRCAFGVTGVSSGAYMRTYAGIVGCRKLETILPLQQDTSVLGAIEDEAIMDDLCCMGRADVYRPATIYRVNLTTHARTPEIDLTPEPDRYSNGTRPLGQDSMATLADNTLYLFVDHAGYRYGDPRFLEAPQRVVNDLRSPPEMVDDSTAIAQTQSEDGALTFVLLRLGSRSVSTLWSAPQSQSAADVFGPGWLYLAPVAIQFTASNGSSPYLRIRDRRELVHTDACTSSHADDHLLILLCPTKQLVGNRYVQYLAAFRW